MFLIYISILPGLPFSPFIIFASSELGNTLSKSGEFKNASICLIGAAVLMSTNASYIEFALLLSNDKSIYLPLGNESGRTASIKTPVSLWYKSFVPLLTKNADSLLLISTVPVSELSVKNLSGV